MFHSWQHCSHILLVHISCTIFIWARTCSEREYQKCPDKQPSNMVPVPKTPVWKLENKNIWDSHVFPSNARYSICFFFLCSSFKSNYIYIMCIYVHIVWWKKNWKVGSLVDIESKIAENSQIKLKICSNTKIEQRFELLRGYGKRMPTWNNIWVQISKLGIRFGPFGTERDNFKLQYIYFMYIIHRTWESYRENFLEGKFKVLCKCENFRNNIIWPSLWPQFWAFVAL